MPCIIWEEFHSGCCRLIVLMASTSTTKWWSTLLSVWGTSLRYIQYTPATIVKKLPLYHRSCECSMTCRERKEHLHEVAHCLTEYLERLLRNTNCERILKIEYHDELCVNVSRINRASLKFLNGIVKRRVCKLTDPMHTHKVNLVVKHIKNWYMYWLYFWRVVV